MEFTLNGKTVQLDDSVGDSPLLWVLRDEFKLTGTRFGCGAGLCGACTVHLNGNAVRSCMIPAATVAGEEVTTIEGLAPDADHPLQIAWISEQVPQCCYCQSGQIMQAAALLSNNPKPSEEEITEWMSGNLCRCGTYQRIKRAVLRVVKAEA
ncbi:(2Fe-2S)-binding protein [Eoetvoesiella caeni]|uniref:(2Fe-2S)-binding protein n=1 Tax=Eoetvoesiella caeni TaxID=645616 RepID=UPI000DEBF0A5|nr:(2Fe-2S)-binding protein [Eoetvoesiella caeni]MCI2811276.1 (2Fe-2S)-binding protein [Eoetvoesiella caeni]NYT57165.1 (2Fe-2S)-binding protein [Eoetvoesiella caeni]